MASSTTSQPTAASNGRTRGPATGTTPTAPEPATVTAPPKLRRRPTLVALGVALIALGGLAAAYVMTAVGHTSPVLALRQDVDRGSIISAADLTVAQIGSDPALNPVPDSQRDQVIGKRASSDLSAGSLLTPQSFTSQVVPARGSSLVGVALTAAQLPARVLRPGDIVRIVDTPRTQDNPPTAQPQSTVATVVDTHDVPDTNQTVVDVIVPTREAALLAASAATGRVALVQDGH